MTIIPPLTDYSILRHVNLDGYRLLTWDPNIRRPDGKDAMGYAFYLPDAKEPLFSGTDFGQSPMHASDSDETLRSLLGFLTLRIGDTDSDYFDDYTPEQLEWSATEAESVGIWAEDEGPDFVDIESD